MPSILLLTANCVARVVAGAAVGPTQTLLGGG